MERSFIIINRCLSVKCPKCKNEQQIMFPTQHVAELNRGRTAEMDCVCGKKSLVKLE